MSEQMDLNFLKFLESRGINIDNYKAASPTVQIPIQNAYKIYQRRKSQELQIPSLDTYAMTNKSYLSFDIYSIFAYFSSPNIEVEETSSKQLKLPTTKFSSGTTTPLSPLPESLDTSISRDVNTTESEEEIIHNFSLIKNQLRRRVLISDSTI
mmetsp:Transcript_16118/g.23471  ORF Transcript_16118/g.23471 Transcript_16118/m.23471 type:complete len:153 (-) Transcript_16118:35-493(-)